MNVDGLESKCRASAFPEGTHPARLSDKVKEKYGRAKRISDESPRRGKDVSLYYAPHATSVSIVSATSALLPGIIPAKKSLQAA